MLPFQEIVPCHSRMRCQRRKQFRTSGVSLKAVYRKLSVYVIEPHFNCKQLPAASEKALEIICLCDRTPLQPMDLLQGTLDLLVLRAVEPAPLHGVGIADRIQQVTRGRSSPSRGRCFPRSAVWNRKAGSKANGRLENNRRARYYKLTRPGRAQLAEEKRKWYRMTSAMNWMLESER
jgi:PadR family transcriptional regulator PadR